MKNNLKSLILLLLLIFIPLTLAESNLGGLWQLLNADGRVVFFDQKDGKWNGSVVCDDSEQSMKEECDPFVVNIYGRLEKADPILCFTDDDKEGRKNQALILTI